MKRERLEDLGRISEKLDKLLEDHNIFNECESKHSLDVFLKKYQNEEALSDLFFSLRSIGSELQEISAIANGDSCCDY